MPRTANRELSGRRSTIGRLMIWVFVAAILTLVLKAVLDERTRRDWVEVGINLSALAASFLIPAAVVLLTRREMTTGRDLRRVAAVLILGALAWLGALFFTYSLILFRGRTWSG